MYAGDTYNPDITIDVWVAGDPVCVGQPLVLWQGNNWGAPATSWSGPGGSGDDYSYTVTPSEPGYYEASVEVRHDGVIVYYLGSGSGGGYVVGVESVAASDICAGGTISARAFPTSGNSFPCSVNWGFFGNGWKVPSTTLSSCTPPSGYEGPVTVTATVGTSWKQTTIQVKKKVKITSTFRYVCVGETKTLAATGGTPPYRWERVLGSVEVGASSGAVTGIGGGKDTLTQAGIMVFDRSNPIGTDCYWIHVVDKEPLQKEIKKSTAVRDTQSNSWAVAEKLISKVQDEINALEKEKAVLIQEQADLSDSCYRVEPLLIALKVSGWIGDYNALQALAAASGWGAALRVVASYIGDAIIEYLYNQGIDALITGMQQELQGRAQEIQKKNSEIKDRNKTLEQCQKDSAAAKAAFTQAEGKIAVLQEQIDALQALCNQ